MAFILLDSSHNAFIFLFSILNLILVILLDVIANLLIKVSEGFKYKIPCLFSAYFRVISNLPA